MSDSLYRRLSVLVNAFRDRPLNRPKPPPAALCAHNKMTLHTQTMSTTFTNDFCACQLSPFTEFRLICSVFVECITSFFEVSSFSNGCVAAMDARLGFGTRLGCFFDRGFW